MYKLHAAAFAQCILLPTLQNVGTKLVVTLPVEKLASKIMFLVLRQLRDYSTLVSLAVLDNYDIKRVILQ